MAIPSLRLPAEDSSALALGLVVHAALAAAGLAALLLLGVPRSYGIALLIILCAAGSAGTLLMFVRRRSAPEDALAEDQRATEELRGARCAAVGELAGSIAHALRGPAARLSTLLSDLSERSDRSEVSAVSGPAGADTFSEARASARRIEGALRDLAEFVAPDGRAPVACDLARLVRTTVDLLEGDLRHRCEVRLALEPLPEAHVHPRRVQHALAVALLAAARALPRRGWLEIGARREDGAIALRVESVPGDGPEVPPAHGDARGLDLALCERLLAHAGGSVRSIPDRRGGMQATLLLRCGAPAPARAVMAEALEER